MAATAAAPATWRGTNDSATEFCRRGNTPAAYGRYQRNNSTTAPYATPPSNVERTTPHHRWYASGERGSGGGAGGESTPSTPGGGTERRRHASGSGSSRSESSSPEPSDTSRASTPAAPLPHAPNHSARRTPPTLPHQWPSTANGRPLAICVRNLPTRSTDSSLKDGLYHEYKKHGKVVWVKVVGQNADRYAVVRFKKPSDVDKALEVSQDKLFFGCKISVAPHQSCDDDSESAKPYETDIDEYHPKATRTLFIGNLEKDVTQQQLRDKFKHFGRIIEIDIKKGSGGGAGYAFCQYASISSVVEAIRAMDGEYVGSSRVKLGFGKPVATTCVWVDGLTEHTEKQVLGAVSRCGAALSVCVDRAAGAALVHFEQAAAAGGAVRELRRVAAQLSAAEPDHPRLCVDYASRECQDAFYEQLEKHGGSASLTAGAERAAAELTNRFLPNTRHEALRYDGSGPRSRAPSFGRSSSRTPRYNSHEIYDPADYAADRRYRVYEELGSSPQTDEANLEERIQSVVVSPHRGHKHRRDSSPEDRKHSKERHRSAGGGSRRSRSGSRGERHSVRRRHRRRRDGSGSRAGTPLRDEPGAPVEPRRPPRERPPLPMSLPLPKFAMQLLRAAPTAPRPLPPPAPASPPRPPSASSSSAGSAPHSPSLEERIRSLDEKYERWTGSRAHIDAPDRSRLRHRLLELDINEVKPSEVVRSLLAKRSVFDEDTERLEGATRAPSPCGSPHSLTTALPRTLRYPFPTHSIQGQQSGPTPPPEPEEQERTIDPRLNRTNSIDKFIKSSDGDCALEARVRLRTPSTDRPPQEINDKKHSPSTVRDHRYELEKQEVTKEERKRRNSILLNADESKCYLSIEKNINEKVMSDKQFENSILMELQEKCDTTDIFASSEDQILSKCESDIVLKPASATCLNKLERTCHRDDIRPRSPPSIPHVLLNKIDTSLDIKIAEKFIFRNDQKLETRLEINNQDEHSLRPKQDYESKFKETCSWTKKENERRKDKFSQNSVNKDISIFDMQPTTHLNTVNCVELSKQPIHNELGSEVSEKSSKEKYNLKIIDMRPSRENIEKENINHDKQLDKSNLKNDLFFPMDRKYTENEKANDETLKNDQDKTKQCKERLDKDIEKEKSRASKNFKAERSDKDKKSREESAYHKISDKTSKIKNEKEDDKLNKDRETDKSKHNEEKYSRPENHKKDKLEKDKKKDFFLMENFKSKKEERYKHERTKKDSSDYKRESKKEADNNKSRKSSRDESSNICRKDSTDSSTSRASHDSSKSKESDNVESKEEKLKIKIESFKFDADKEIKLFDCKVDGKFRIKSEIKDEKNMVDQHNKNKPDNVIEITKSKGELSEKQRHYSLDSPNLESKRKERLNSCSSLPSNIGHKRRMSSQDLVDHLCEEVKKSKNDSKYPERRDSKDSRSLERHKSTKFNKGHFAKIIESKTKDDKKNQVKPPDDMIFDNKDINIKETLVTDKNKSLKSSSSGDFDEKTGRHINTVTEPLQNNFDFLATLELRSSEEDEKQKALRKEIKEKKRIQQLQQIQELQIKHNASLIQSEQLGKTKDDKKQINEDRKRDAAREKRMSTDRKSKDDKNDHCKRKNRKQVQSTDSSDSDEPKKHSIFDIVDDGPQYISMYDKVKARSCKNMQKQEEEKRQEKIKAKFSQLKQSRAKREEKKRSSWDEDSESDHDRGKSHKMDSSSDDDQISINNKKREKYNSTSNLDYDRNRDEFFSTPSNDEDFRNKLLRKNSRTRIISDTSDDDYTSNTINGPSYVNKIKKEMSLSSESLPDCRDSDIQLKECSEDKIKKTSLLNLFGKSDSEDNRQKLNLDIHNDYKSSFVKSFSNDLSSGNESNPQNKNHSELRKKHKKKQKKYKFSYSDDEFKTENSTNMLTEIESKHKNTEKSRRHSNKKEKRKEKIRESIDADELREDKIKSQREKISPVQSYDSISESVPSCIKKEGRMEDIFGPLSDESDKETSFSKKVDSNSLSFESAICGSSNKLNCTSNTDETKRDKDDSRRKKDKKRKDKKYFSKDDENSLDVDAVSKAIEACLFADTDSGRLKSDNYSNSTVRQSDSLFRDCGIKPEIDSANNKHIDRLKRDSRDRKKKKKRNREDKRSRKNHHNFYDSDKVDGTDNIETIELCHKTMLLDIPLPNDAQKTDNTEKSDDYKSLSESPSLPRITDSPPFIIPTDENISNINDDGTPNRLIVDERIEIDYEVTKNIEVNEIPMPPPIENIVQDISEVPLPEDPPLNAEKPIINDSPTDYDISNADANTNEDAVRSIPDLDKENVIQKDKESNELQIAKLDKKVDEKPRAIISQEETEDAVAALLGESFGGKVNTFQSCYEESENNTTHQIEIESTVIETEIIPEEDAEEMRQAVQNLNACEMEIKPDTPVSDSDLLLIDTDTEETEDSTQDAIERLPVNIIATNQSLNNNTKKTVPQLAEISNVINPKPQTTNPNTTAPENITVNKNSKEVEIKPQIKQEIIQQSSSTATPVITSWTLSNNKLLDSKVLNLPSSPISTRDNENKTTHITTNILPLKKSQNQNIQLNNSLRPIINSSRVTAPYQVINHMIRPQISNMQPPTIKIPEPHIIYQKPQGIVISPRMTNDPRLMSPKTSPRTDSMTSPRLTNMTILNTSPQNINSVGISSPNTLQQRSPGQVTVVRMQQPPLSPIQTMNLPHGTRAMVSPNRPNSVLVQTQGTPIHFNRLPVTPVLAPISKQLSGNTLIQQTKNTSGSNSPILHGQKIMSGDGRKAENIIDNTKIILSPTRLQQNATIMAQNRLIFNSNIPLPNKVMINNKGQLSDKRENISHKTDHNHIVSAVQAPIIHVANVSQSTASIIQTSTKSGMCKPLDVCTISRGQGSNVIHTINSQRLLTTTPMTNVIQIDSNKCATSVLSVASLRQPTVLTKSDLSSSTVVTTTSITNVVMTPLLLKTSPSSKATIRLHPRVDGDSVGNHSPVQSQSIQQDNKMSVQLQSNVQLDNKLPLQVQSNNLLENKVPLLIQSNANQDNKCDDNKNNQLEITKTTSNSTIPDVAPKSETDFEELLKDNTNEIKVTNNPEKELEVNVGKMVSLTTQNHQCINSVNDENNQNCGPKEDITSFPNNKQIPTEVTNKEDDDRHDITEKELKNTPVQLDTKQISNELSVNNNLSKSANDHKDNFIPNSHIDVINCFDTVISHAPESPICGLKNIEENDYWTANDVNIESVIKKVDSLCNDSFDEKKDLIINKEPTEVNPFPNTSIKSDLFAEDKAAKVESLIENHSKEVNLVEKVTVGKRGGRNGRGKKSEKKLDRTQHAKIAKSPRGTSKRGRGRGKMDKKVKNLVVNSSNNIPGDVYDFHEDSGDETSTSPNKAEVRPRLILTIKSPISGNSNAVATSTLSITTPKDQVRVIEKPKEDKSDIFASPSSNTRKSRRLQEKDIQRNTVDDIIDDVIRSSAQQIKSNKECAKKRSARQAGLKNSVDKSIGGDTRKSPRGTKRIRDRSISDASIDSNEDTVKREEIVKDAKIPKLAEPIISTKVEPEPLIKPSTAVPTIVNHTANPTPIMKPPKKMISEISAKLAGAFDIPANVIPKVGMNSPNVPERSGHIQTERIEPDKLVVSRELRTFEATPATENHQMATAETAAEASAADMAHVRRIVDNVPPNMMPVGATEATDARVQSPALPHRPSASHRPPDRATPILVRGGDGEAGGMGALGAAGVAAGVAAGAGAGPARFRGAYPGPASLPRGAHHPPPQPQPQPLIKQVGVVGPHHHPASRITITSVPSISPQGQMSLSADLARSPPPAHQQTSPITSVYHNGDGMYPHFSQHHYQMYQQHFRATQHENRATPTPFTRGALEAEGTEAAAPPLELRRAPGARVPRPAHSPSPADRHILYAVRCGRSPPPAHGTSRPPSALPPPAAPGPPHASQVPREADSLQMLLRRYPVMWQGLLALKNDSAAVQMHFVGGNPGVAADALSRNSDGSSASLLRIAQRMRLEPVQLDQVHRKMKLELEHCILLALPCGRDHMDVLQQSTNLSAGFITYLQRKQAAGIVNVAPTPQHQQSMYTVHIFPSCEFANENLNRIAPDLMHRVANIAHLLIVIATAIG